MVLLWDVIGRCYLQHSDCDCLYHSVSSMPPLPISFTILFHSKDVHHSDESIGMLDGRASLQAMIFKMASILPLH